MFDNKTLLMTITLVLITFIHYGFAPPRAKTQNEIDCEILMGRGWYESGNSVGCGKRNFSKSFKHYTFSMLHNTYNPRQNENETHDEQKTRLLKRELFTNYFLDLGITFSSVFPNQPENLPSKWCARVVTAPSERKEDEILNCMDILQNYFHVDDSMQPHEIYSKLYDDYIIDSLKNIPETEMPLNYPLGFFEHYYGILNYKNTKRVHFKTIEDFCRGAGGGMVENKESLQEKIPMP